MEDSKGEGGRAIASDLKQHSSYRTIVLRFEVDGSVPSTLHDAKPQRCR